MIKKNSGHEEVLDSGFDYHDSEAPKKAWYA